MTKLLMAWFRNLPIRRKLILICLFTSGSALLMACGAFFVNEQVNFRQRITRDLSITAQMIGLNSTAAIAFRDRTAAENTLHALNANLDIAAAAIFDLDGEIFATYERRENGLMEWPVVQPEGIRFHKGQVDLFHDIYYGGEKLGTLFLRSDLGQVRRQWWNYASISGLVLIVSTLVAWLIAVRLQRVISIPILKLAKTASHVADGSDISIRAEKHSDDEIGKLTDDFNAMLARIDDQNADLRAAHHYLEERVEKRTAELKKAQEEAAREHARFRFIFESLPVGVAWMIWGRVESRIVNPEFAKISGISRERCQNLDLYIEATHPDDRERQAKFVKEIAAGKIDSYSLEKRYRRSDGTYCWALLVVRHLCDVETGEVQELSMLLDISDRKEAAAELEKSHRLLLDVSRQAGMAEVATNVLHNVGNVLNSVNVSATLVDEQIRRSRSSSVARLSNLLKEHTDDLAAFLTEDPKGRQIPAFLETLSQQLETEQKNAISELQSLRANVDHIKEIVAMQQSHARTAGVTETVAVSELVENGISMVAASFERHGVKIVEDFQLRSTVVIERHKVLQILVNLFQNARQACEEGETGEKTVTVRVSGDENGWIEIAVADTGIGIAPESLSRIFSHGFTTRKEGHGFGLHSSALAAKEMGGSLRVESEGIGKGATFTLRFPMAHPGEEG